MSSSSRFAFQKRVSTDFAFRDPKLPHSFDTTGISYPPHLGDPHRSDCGYFYEGCRALMFSRGSISDYNKITPQIVVDRYELTAVLADGSKTNIALPDDFDHKVLIAFRANLHKEELKRQFAQVPSGRFYDWIKTLVPATEKSPGPDYFLIVLRGFPVIPCKFDKVHGDVYWCGRWPTTLETQSMLVSIDGEFSFGIPTLSHHHN